jgi:hypothetical protein
MCELATVFALCLHFLTCLVGCGLRTCTYVVFRAQYGGTALFLKRRYSPTRRQFQSTSQWKPEILTRCYVSPAQDLHPCSLSLHLQPIVQGVFNCVTARHKADNRFCVATGDAGPCCMYPSVLCRGYLPRLPIKYVCVTDYYVLWHCS